MSQMVEISQSSRLFALLTTGRLILRRMQAADAEAIFKILADDEVTR